ASSGPLSSDSCRVCRKAPIAASPGTDIGYIGFIGGFMGDGVVVGIGAALVIIPSPPPHADSSSAETPATAPRPRASIVHSLATPKAGLRYVLTGRILREVVRTTAPAAPPVPGACGGDAMQLPTFPGSH